MPQFFLNKRLIILLISTIVLVVLIGFSIRDRDNISWPEKFVKDTVGFSQSLVVKPANSVAGFFGNMKEVRNTFTENQKLKKRLDEILKLETQVNDLKKDNQELRATLDKTDNIRAYDSINATVISRNTDRWQEYVNIDKGEAHGVKKDLAVITSEGLIGKVKSTSEFYSTVELLTADNISNRISAIVQGSKNVTGIIEGYNEEEKVLLLQRIPPEAKIKKGQSVITSGLGGVFPKGLVIGKITELVPDEFGLTQSAYVQPVADFNQLEHVIVVDRTILESDSEEIKVEDEANE